MSELTQIQKRIYDKLIEHANEYGWFPEPEIINFKRLKQIIYTIVEGTYNDERLKNINDEAGKDEYFELENEFNSEIGELFFHNDVNLTFIDTQSSSYHCDVLTFLSDEIFSEFGVNVEF